MKKRWNKIVCWFNGHEWASAYLHPLYCTRCKYDPWRFMP